VKGSATGCRAIIIIHGSLRVYPERQFEAYVNTLHESRRMAKTQSVKRKASIRLHMITESASTVEWDRAGRVALPPQAASLTKLTPGDRIAVHGIMGHLEVCAEENARMALDDPDYKKALVIIRKQYERNVNCDGY